MSRRVEYVKLVQHFVGRTNRPQCAVLEQLIIRQSFRLIYRCLQVVKPSGFIFCRTAKKNTTVQSTTGNFQRCWLCNKFFILFNFFLSFFIQLYFGIYFLKIFLSSQIIDFAIPRSYYESSVAAIYCKAEVKAVLWSSTVLDHHTPNTDLSMNLEMRVGSGDTVAVKQNIRQLRKE